MQVVAVVMNNLLVKPAVRFILLRLVTSELERLLIKAPGDGLPDITKRAKQRLYNWKVWCK